MYLFFDIETTGLPKDWSGSIENSDNWPYIVQIAWILESKDNRILAKNNFIIQPRNYFIPRESTRIHGISNEKAIQNGVNIKDVLTEFIKDLGKSKYVIAHNLEFDYKIFLVELSRCGIRYNSSTKGICTMKKSTDFCKLPGKYGYKWPKLEELHSILFGESTLNFHDAMVDIQATRKCFWSLKSQGVISLIGENISQSVSHTTTDFNNKVSNQEEIIKSKPLYEEKLLIRMATYSERLGAAIIDGFIVGFITNIISTLIGILGDIEASIYMSLVTYAILLIGYFTILESNGRVSVGKSIGKLSTVTEEENSLTIIRAFSRSIFRYVSQILFYIGFIMIFVNRNNLSLHDYLTKTKVVKKETVKVQI
jgi:DNA polymerase III epsilon subunit-like protein